MAKKSTNKRQNRAPPTTRGKNPQFSVSEYRISFEPVVDHGIPRQLREQIAEIFPLVQDDPRQAITRLEYLRQQYPRIPLITNHLIVAHGWLDNKEVVRDLVMRNHRENPDYLFARINYAQMCLHANQPEKIPEIFEEKYDLKLLYPKRKEFFVTEFSGFAGVMCAYFSVIGQKDVAQLYYDALLQVDPDSEMASFAKRFIKPSLLDRLRFWMQARSRENDKLKENENKLMQAGNAGNKKPLKENNTRFTA